MKKLILCLAFVLGSISYTSADDLKEKLPNLLDPSWDCFDDADQDLDLVLSFTDPSAPDMGYEQQHAIWLWFYDRCIEQANCGCDNQE